MLQIATDCVYSGKTGGYVEEDSHDCTDVYGKTKSLGECRTENVSHLRCSIIGPELSGRSSLLEWFRGQEEGASVTGFTDHQWNGITTLHFAKLCCGVIAHGLSVEHMQHVVPSGSVSKADLLLEFARCFERGDVRVEKASSPGAVNRTLSTSRPETNDRLWKCAGYAQPPSVPRMIEELAAYRLGG